MRIAIVGSRRYPNERQVRAFVRDLAPDTVVISGDDPGVDSWAVDEARRLGFETVVHEAEGERHGLRGGAVRNDAIVADADTVVAFWDGVSRGTAATIRTAREAGKPHDVFYPWPVY